MHKSIWTNAFFLQTEEVLCQILVQIKWDRLEFGAIETLVQDSVLIEDDYCMANNCDKINGTDGLHLNKASTSENQFSMAPISSSGMFTTVLETYQKEGSCVRAKLGHAELLSKLQHSLD